MCFTVAILRNKTLLTIEKYYESLPDNWEKQNDLPEFSDYFFVSGFSHPQLPVLMPDGVQFYSWGLIPSWVKSDKEAIDIRSKTLNAVGETVFEKASYKKCIQSQRCLLPVTGFYEFQDIHGVKYPYFVFPNESESFFIGAVYDHWMNVESGEMSKSFSILTTPANSLMEKIHNLKKRMPLILNKEDSYYWIDRKTDSEKIRKLIRPFEDSKMSAYTISRIANNVRKNRNIPEIMDEFNYTLNEPPLQTTLF